MDTISRVQWHAVMCERFAALGNDPQTREVIAIHCRAEAEYHAQEAFRVAAIGTACVEPFHWSDTVPFLASMAFLACFALLAHLGGWL